ncbi:PREDICTED: uncharacterized protein LOC105361688 [Ceratosolen solmsi marchali]|uniref:Uncharacterized protein LOC105361688 n=1 Tax=Ceratosolen solmsi marchali TaxID=326594 RepID=A0AAJ6YFR2_9HYME|nr:PREDICTED: uncharacterized protein LOC105361688 [Ceratosolen solmsi marchali]
MLSDSCTDTYITADISNWDASENVAPLKELTIPKLELAAALLLSKLMAHIKTTLGMKEFVCNRVTQIQELTSEAQWRYVPAASNPADCASRGLTTKLLKDHPLWWTGPPWITTPDSWPTQPTEMG